MPNTNYPQVLKPKSGTCDQSFNHWYMPNLSFLTPSESTFVKARRIIRLLKSNPSLSIREISEKAGIDKKDIPHLIGRMAAKNMIQGNGHSVVNGKNEVQLRLTF
jgi:predicted HTH transcriptional regulator